MRFEAMRAGQRTAATFAGVGALAFVCGVLVMAAASRPTIDLEQLCLSGALSRFSDRLPFEALPRFCECVADMSQGSQDLKMKGFQCQTHVKWLLKREEPAPAAG